MSTTRFPEDPAANHPPKPERVETRIVIPPATLVRVALAVVLTMAALSIFRSLIGVIVLVVLSLLIAVVLSDLADWLERRGVTRGIAALMSIVTVLVTVGFVLLITIPPLVRELDEFITNLPNTAASLRARLSGRPELYDALAHKFEELGRNPSKLLSGAFHFGWGVATNVFGGVLMLTLTLYLLIDRENTRAGVLRRTPVRYRTRVDATLNGTADVIKGYFIGRSIISAIYAVYTFALLTVLDVPYAIVFAALGFILSAIPNIGSLVATVLPSLIALAYRGITTALIVAAALLVYQQLENSYVQPRIFSKKLNVTPIATMLGVLIGGKLLGIIGVILAVPAVGMLPVIERVWFRHEPATTTSGIPSSTPRAEQAESGDVAA